VVDRGAAHPDASTTAAATHRSVTESPRARVVARHRRWTLVAPTSPKGSHAHVCFNGANAERRGATAMRNFLKEFKDFIATGNMIELAVAVILGLAIGRVITAFTDGVMMNLVAAIFGEPNFDEVRLKISDEDRVLKNGDVSDGTYLEIGTVITALIALILTGLVLFLVIKAYNHMRKPADAGPAGPTEVELLIQIRDTLQSR
jgi:large conductance mechanosensitive channel